MIVFITADVASGQKCLLAMLHYVMSITAKSHHRKTASESSQCHCQTKEQFHMYNPASFCSLLICYSDSLKKWINSFGAE